MHNDQSLAGFERIGRLSSDCTSIFRRISYMSMWKQYNQRVASPAGYAYMLPNSAGDVKRFTV
jgi:hypothetical protein